jgi:membrane protein required for colicin V production
MTYINIFDVIILLLIVWGAMKGFQKGFFNEFLSLLIFVVVTLISFKFIHLAFDMGGKYTGKVPKAVPFFILMFIFLAVSLGLNIWGKKRLDKEVLSIFDSFDNIMGIVVAVFKYVLAISLFLWLCTHVGIIQASKDGWNNTIFYPFMMKFFNKLVEVGANVMPFLKDLEIGTRKLLKN